MRLYEEGQPRVCFEGSLHFAFPHSLQMEL